MAAEQSVAEILDKAADLIEPEGAWTQEFEARDGSLLEVEPLSDEAVCFCAGGAIYRADRGGTVWLAAWRFFERHVGGDGPTWNDAPERTQSEVVAKLREAAALARKQAS